MTDPYHLLLMWLLWRKRVHVTVVSGGSGRIFSLPFGADFCGQHFHATLLVTISDGVPMCYPRAFA